MRKQLLIVITGATLLSASKIHAQQSWLLGGQNVPAAGGILGSNNNRPVIFETNNIERARILNSGLWGFGTNSPIAQVHINTAINGQAPLQVDALNQGAMIVNSEGRAGFGTLFPSARLNVNSTSGEDPVLVEANGSRRFYVASNGGVAIGSGPLPPANGLFVSGNTGIGTASPVVKLHVVAGSDASPDGGGFIVNGSLSGTNLVIDDNEIMVRNNGVPSVLTLNNNGGNVIIDGTKSGSRLGLGTASPATDLHIVHGVGNGSTNGLRLKNDGFNAEDWTFYVQNGNGVLELYANNVLRGTFDDVSGTYSSVSDIRGKKDIERSPDLIDKVLQLGIMKYHFLENKSSDKKYYGLIAQDVEKIFPEVVSHHKADDGKEYHTVDYSSFGVLAIKAIQEQQNKITILEERLAKLEAAIARGNVGLTSGKSVNAEISNGILEQNQPNPFNQTATIRYDLADNAKAQINIYDAAGKPVKTLQATGGQQAQVNAADLKAGAYTYTLIVNGKTVASRKMVIAK